MAALVSVMGRQSAWYGGLLPYQESAEEVTRRGTNSQLPATPAFHEEHCLGGVMLELCPQRDTVQEVKPSETGLNRKCQFLVQQCVCVGSVGLAGD